MPADVNSPSPREALGETPSASRGEGELTSAGRLRFIVYINLGDLAGAHKDDLSNWS